MQKESINDRLSWRSGYFINNENNKADWNNLTEEKLKFILEEGRLCLQNIFDSLGYLSQKATFLITLIGGAISYIFVEFILKFKQFNMDDWYVWPLAAYFVVLICVFFILIKYLLPSLDYEALGNVPENLLTKEEMAFDYKKIVVSQLEYYQHRINLNLKQNYQAARDIKRCFCMVIIYPILTSIALFVICYLWN